MHLAVCDDPVARRFNTLAASISSSPNGANSAVAGAWRPSKLKAGQRGGSAPTGSEGLIRAGKGCPRSKWSRRRTAVTGSPSGATNPTAKQYQPVMCCGVRLHLRVRLISDCLGSELWGEHHPRLSIRCGGEKGLTRS